MKIKLSKLREYIEQLVSEEYSSMQEGSLDEDELEELERFKTGEKPLRSKQSDADLALDKNKKVISRIRGR